jgi:hypothetical protein
MATTWVQTHARFRNDDGSQTTATWKAALDTNISVDVGAGNVNLRIRISSSQTGTTGAKVTGTLYLSKNGGAYAAVTDVTSSVKAIASANFADEDATTQQISSGTFVAGKMDEVNGACTATGTIAQNSVTEHEFSVQLISADLASGNTLDFRMRNGSTAYTTYTVTPRITVLKSSSLTMNVGSYAVTGVNQVLKSAHKITSDVGSYSQTGININLLVSRGLLASVGSYLSTGVNTPILAQHKVTGAVGSYSLTGVSTPLVMARKIVAAVGSYIQTGIDAILGLQKRLTVSVGSYSLTGVDTPLLSAHKIISSIGSYGLTGNEATFTIQTLLHDYVMTVNVGVYNLTGHFIGLSKYPPDIFKSSSQPFDSLSEGNSVIITNVKEKHSPNINSRSSSMAINRNRGKSE